MNEDVTVRIAADTQPFEQALKSLDTLSRGFGAQLTGALKSAAVSGKELDDILRQLAVNLAGMALSQGLAPMQGLASSLFGGLLKGLGGAVGFAQGGAPVGAMPFASGGVVSKPTYFASGGALGLMGEAGSEAILPLRRGADGNLGVAAAASGQAVNVVFNVTTPDAPSFRKSEAQIAGMLARTVGRGSRTL